MATSAAGLDWFKQAVFYEVFIWTFFDSDGDGKGDIRGLVDKLDYLSWLGVDCLWLLPYYPSPMRDGGYDVSDLLTVHPDLGQMDDLKLLISEAHDRGIRVIADMVMNHTSDQHPWFVESRRSKDGPKADWYVWSEEPRLQPDSKVVFVDVEESNWAFDSVRGEYYSHRFYSHQPDLNFANVEVVEAMTGAIRYWLDLGLDGFRLDAVPYLFERDDPAGTDAGEAAHALLRKLRGVVDAYTPKRLLLAEANLWIDELVEYFGEGDECDMCFHFPLMPRLFLAVRRESRFPLTEILSRTPDVPASCQWAIFLRNHDELTLEKVTEEERDQLVAEYARDPRMRRHWGIGRRLAPLIEGNRTLAELLWALIFSLPGSPVIYYGDELLMGDNVYLGDRDSVRTPMQWSPDRNGGFSKANLEDLFLPPVTDSVYGYGAVNVEAQQANPSSFLQWMQRMLQVRHQYSVFGSGSFELVDCANPSILAYVRVPAPAPAVESAGAAGSGAGTGGRGEGTGGSGVDVERSLDQAGTPAGPAGPVLCVHNLSRFPQPVELDLSEYVGAVPTELLGRVRFPAVRGGGYPVTLSSHGYLWLELSGASQVPAGRRPTRRRGLSRPLSAGAGHVAAEGHHDRRRLIGRIIPGGRRIGDEEPLRKLGTRIGAKSPERGEGRGSRSGGPDDLTAPSGDQGGRGGDLRGPSGDQSGEGGRADRRPGR